MEFRQINWIFCMGLLLAVRCVGQSSSPRSGMNQPPTVSQTVPGSAADDVRERAGHDLAKKANLERQAALKKDTDRLVKLAGELKEYVDKSNENLLSLDVLKKADEIEKLARSVKDKMKGPN